MKAIAYYLPQFHAIPENDQWWGRGFTEWTNVRRALPLFRGHYQPRTPARGQYYDLTDIGVMIEQARLAREHHVYGFCYYHYWFDGVRLLEAPLERMLEEEAVDIPFCLSWANEPWTRAWDGLSKDILMPQSYGGEADWRRHFECLVRFFCDPRYIKIDNCPVFLIYRTASIQRVDEMTQVWSDLARKAGFRDLYLVETMNSFQKIPRATHSRAVVEFEPMYSLTHHYPSRKRVLARLWNRLRYKGVNTKHYKDVWDVVVKKKAADYGAREVFPGAFVDWDNSPRKGNKGLILRGAHPALFESFLRQKVRNSDRGSRPEFLFLNAWNEWAEGAYIEPDEKHGTLYLEALARVMSESEVQSGP